MSLSRSFEKSGLVLFKHRGNIPFVLFVTAIPIVFLTDYSRYSPELIFGLKAAAIAICLLGFIIRAYTIGTAHSNTSGRNTYEQKADRLNTTGIYSMVRHPLYLGNYLMWAGICVYAMHPWFFLVMSLAYWIYYERIMYAEEQYLERKFGEEYVAWAGRTNAFVPSFKNYTQTSNPFLFKRVLAKEYSGLLVMVLSFIYIQLLQDIKYHERFVISRTALIILGITLVIVGVLRFISRNYWVRYRD